MESYLMMNGVRIELTPQQLQLLGIEIKEKVIQWEDFGNIEGFYLDKDNRITSHLQTRTGHFNKDVFPTIEEIEARLALSQLCQWRNKYNEGWKPTWTDLITKYIICYADDKMCKNVSTGFSRILVFKTEKIRDTFFEDFKDLIETAKPLL